MKNKMNLNDLKVTSFVTNLDKASEETVKGGAPTTSNINQWTNGFPTCHVSLDPRKCTGHSELAAACQSGNIKCIPPLDEKPHDISG